MEQIIKTLTLSLFKAINTKNKNKLSKELDINTEISTKVTSELDKVHETYVAGLRPDLYNQVTMQSQGYKHVDDLLKDNLEK